ncbi:hypothetical protein ACET3Z_033130 [Daucus carota]|nr:PREDICTED: uncharacterized protein LOC108202378 [Daucus carota subsp. sativus]
MNMAALTKLYLVATVFLLFSNYSARCISASALDHQGSTDELKSRWFRDCETGRYTKLDRLKCRNAFRLRNTGKAPWSESLKKALSPPPAPDVMRGSLPSEDDAPPPPST